LIVGLRSDSEGMLTALAFALSPWTEWQVAVHAAAFRRMDQYRLLAHASLHRQRRTAPPCCPKRAANAASSATYNFCAMSRLNLLPLSCGCLQQLKMVQ